MAMAMATADTPIQVSSLIRSDTFYASLIDNSIRKSHLRQVHARLLELGLQFSGFLIAKLIHASSDLRDMCYARQVFDDFPHPDIFSWNALIRGYSRNGFFQDTLQMYSLMQQARVSPDAFTFPHVLKACNGLPALDMGRRIHGQIFRHGFTADVFVQNGLIALYAKCRHIHRARTVFDKLPERTVVSWTSIISGYTQNDQPMEALKIFSQMRKRDVKPDWISLVSVLSAFTDVQDLKQGGSVHGSVVKMGLETEPDLLISLTAMYAKCGQMEIAEKLFEKKEIPNLMLWNAMISGYARNGYVKDAINLFKKMIGKNIRPDTISITSAVSACAQLGSLEQARWMDVYVSKSNHRHDVIVNTALIDMYAKCGSIESARSVFDRTRNKDVVAWSAMIIGYGLHGKGREAIDLYRAMEGSGMCPNDVTFLGLLMACNHSGLVQEGWRLFHRMKDYNIKAEHQHYACVVDLLGRAGFLDKAYDFIKNMPIPPGITVWGALLSACRVHRDVILGEYAAKQLFAMDPMNTGHYVQLSNIYAAARMWDHVTKTRVVMKEKGLCKDLSWSSVEIGGKLERFHVGDKSHPRYEEIERELEWLESRLKGAAMES